MKLDPQYYEILYRIPFNIDKSQFMTEYPPVLSNFLLESNYSQIISSINLNIHKKPKTFGLIVFLALFSSITSITLYCIKFIPLSVTIGNILLNLLISIFYLVRIRSDNTVQVLMQDFNLKIDAFNKQLFKHDVTLSLVGNFMNDVESPTYLLIWIKKK